MAIMAMLTDKMVLTFKKCHQLNFYTCNYFKRLTSTCLMSKWPFKAHYLDWFDQQYR